MILSWTYHGEIVPKARPRVYRGRAVTPKRTVDFERTFGLLARLALGRAQLEQRKAWPLDDRYLVSVVVSPKAARRMDLDNQLKSVLDALNGVLWTDDSQVDAVSVRRVWTYAGAATIEVHALGTVGPLSKRSRRASHVEG